MTPSPLNCHPATAWTLMIKGMSLSQIARRYGDTLGELDRAVWAWRAARSIANQAMRDHARVRQA